MRILAVRGRNLASIPWFEVDLEKGPLASTRIFAISGPTGAGKSTLLDTISLALYDRAPRLVGARDTGGDEHEIRGTDPRAIMRRHTYEAAAEIDFVGQDGVRYRSTWEVWRAHRKASGKMQPQKMTLAELDSGRDVSGATKTETLAMIEERVGLSFDEFRRAVLLAQGDFAAFLEARGDQRAELLEKMTGTHLYGALSREAFARAKEAAAALEALRVKQDAIALLDEEAHAALVEEQEKLTTSKVEVEANLATAQQAVTWHERRDALEKERTAAEASLEAVEAEWKTAKAERSQLAARRRADSLAPTYRSFSEADKREQTNAAAAEKAQAEVGAKNDAKHAAANQLAAAARASTAIQDAIEAMAEDLDRARTLDAQIADAAKERESAKVALDAADETWRGAADAAEAARVEAEDKTAAIAKIDAYLSENAHLEPVAKLWPRWETVLDDARAVRAFTTEQREALVSLKKARAEVEAEHTTVEAARVAAEKQRDGARERLDRATAAFDAYAAVGNAADIADARSIVARRIQDLVRMEDIPRETKKLEKEAREAAQEAADELEHAKRKKAERKDARRKMKKLSEKLVDAEADYERSEAVRAVATRRAELLEPGHACPLCGSTEHPYGTEGPEPKKNARLKRRVKRLSTDLERTRATASRSKDEDAQHVDRSKAAKHRADVTAKEIELRVEEWVSKREALELIWTESSVLARRGLRRLALEVPESPDEKRAAKQAATVRAQLEAEQAELESWSGQGTKLLEARESKRRALDEATVTFAATSARADKVAQALADHDVRIEGIEKAIADRTARLEALANQLKLDADSPWRRALAEDPDTLATSLTESIETLEARRQAKTEAERALQTAQKTQALAQAKHDAALAERKKAEALFEQRDTRAKTLAETRGALLEGRTVEAQLADNAAAKSQALQAEKGLREALDAATEAASAAIAHHKTVTASLRDVQMERAAVELELFGLLDEAEIESIEALQALLAADTGELETKLEALNERRTSAQTTAKDSAARLEAHVEAGAPELDAAAALERRDALARQKDALVEATGRAAERLRANETARAALAELAPKIEAQQQQADRWAEINEVIGSADGKKLRTFAQGLTLEVLLEQANLHLGQLRPRYRLRRVKATDMELEVIDGDMGDEVRATSTLSGGERFLVSLALALGLSSMSSRNVRIESLFVDEGFGTLDRDTLEVALTTLDQLQSEGRTIGIISHLPEIAERIGYQIEVEPVAPGKSEVRVLER
ncbi:MAG: AAA family ATPase [Deltaproteobacteria bacterium]